MKRVVPAPLSALESQRNLVSHSLLQLREMELLMERFRILLYTKTFLKKEEKIIRDVRGSIILLEEQCFEFSGA